MTDELIGDVLKEFGRLEGGRRVWDSHFQELADVLWPGMASFTRRGAPGEKRTGGIYDGTPMLAVRGLVSAIDGMLKPKTSRWMSIRAAATAAVRGLIEREPEGALARLEAGAFDDRFDKADLTSLRGEAKTAARAKGARDSAAERARRRALALDMEDHLAALAETGRGDETLEARARADLPDIEYAAFQADQAAARERYATRAEYAFMTPQEIEHDIAAKASGDGPSDGDERDRTHAIRKAVRDEVLAARAADPAGWAMRDEDVAAAFAAAEENPDDPALAHKATKQRLALQREMGIEQPRLLSVAERDEIATALAHATPADRAALVTDLRGRYGVQVGMLETELTGELDANTALLLTHADIPHLPRLLANGMEKAGKGGPADLKVARSEDENPLPALPIIDKGEHGGRRLNMVGMKPGLRYRAADGTVLLYDGEALIPVVVEIASPDPANPNAPTQPLPLGEKSPEREAAVKGIAYELGEEGNPVETGTGGASIDDAGMADLEEADPGLATGPEDDGTGLVDGTEADGEVGTAADARVRKQKNMAVWLGWAGFSGDPLPGWKELPRLDGGRIDRDALEDDQVYHVVGKDGRRSAWRWNEGERSFVPYGRWVDAFSTDGMHELLGVPVRRISEGRPIYNMEQDRVNSINWNTDAVFEIAENPDADDSYRVQDMATASYAMAKVVEHSMTIERLAKEHGVNPDLVKAIMFREQAAGPLQPMADFARVGKTISPMGINPEKWSGLGIDRTAARNSEDNIRAAIVLIKRIQDRIADPTVEKTATLYNGLMMEEVSDYGAQVGRYYQDKPWLDWDPPEVSKKQNISP